MSRTAKSPLNRTLTEAQEIRVQDLSRPRDYEADARRLVAIHSVVEPWSHGQVIVMAVMRSMWSSSLPTSRIEAVARAVHGFTEVSLQDALTELTRLGYLRSRMVNLGGEGRARCYELNY